MKGFKSLEYRIWARSYNKNIAKKETSRLGYLDKVYKLNSKINFNLKKSCLSLANAKWNCSKEINLSLPKVIVRTIHTNSGTEVFSTQSVILNKTNFKLYFTFCLN